jgi:hypothetical protein
MTGPAREEQLYGIRVRRLRIAERDATGLAWAVEVGRPRGDRKGYADAKILSRHATQREACAALLGVIRSGSR